MNKSFVELYCEDHRLAYDQFVRDVFWKALFPHARLFAAVLPRGTFQFDLDFISSAGRATRIADVRDCVKDFYRDRAQLGFIRRRWSIRVSGRRVIEIASAYLPKDGSDELRAGSSGSPGP